jgi:hypothetical protein
MKNLTKYILAVSAVIGTAIILGQSAGSGCGGGGSKPIPVCVVFNKWDT